jgi:hypothetical protein
MLAINFPPGGVAHDRLWPLAAIENSIFEES